MSFIPETPPVSSPDLAEYLARLEQRIAQAFEQKDDVGVTETEPEKVFVGMIRYADGSGWDPGSGQGMYAYDDTGWIKVGAAVWGLIAGSLSDQTDLQAALDGKSDVGHTHVKADITDFNEADYATAAQGTNADTAYSWGDHALVGYLTSYTETDPVFVASDAYSITSTQITNWNSAYGWGDHALAGYFVNPATANLDMGAYSILFDTGVGLVADNGAELKTGPSGYTWTAVPGDDAHAGFQVMEDTGTYRLALFVDGAEVASKWISHFRDVTDSADLLTLNHTDETLAINVPTTLTKNLLIDQGTTSQTAQLAFADTDTTLTTYDLSHIRRNTDSIQIGFQKSSDGSSANALVIDGDDTDGLDLVTFRGAPIRFRYHGGNNEFHIYNGYVQAENALVLNPLSSAPGSPTTGMLAYADGTSWDPGSGAGVYVYKGAGWTFIA